MKYLLSLLCLSTLISTLQAQGLPPQYDFSSVDVSKVDIQKLRDHMDSLNMAFWSDSLVQLHNYVTSTQYTPKYFGFVFGVEDFYGSFDYMNAGLRQLGIDEVDDRLGAISWGIEIKSKRLLWSYRFAPGIKNSVENDEAIIETRGFVGADFSIGYDLVNARRFQLYPLLGLTWQSLEIDVKRKNAVNDINNVNTLLSNYATTELEKDDLTLTYAVQADVHLSYSDADGGIIIGLRYGQSTELASGNYKINGKKSAYNSDDKLRQSFLSLVLKFYMKN